MACNPYFHLRESQVICERGACAWFQEYNLTYRVFDGLGDDTMNLRIRIQPQNIFPPIFSQVTYQGPNNIQEKDDDYDYTRPIAEVRQTKATVLMN